MTNLDNVDMYNPAPLTPIQAMTKRFADLLLAGLAVIILFPLFALISLAIKLEGRTPSILQWRRAVFKGREFKVYSFRTTTRNADEVTRVGRLLRATAMDDLPQLINVICGQMSFIGPPLPTSSRDESSDLVAQYASKRGLKLGLACWSQVRGLPPDAASARATQQRIEFERWYIDNWSVWLDLRILLHSFVWRIPASQVHV